MSYLCGTRFSRLGHIVVRTQVNVFKVLSREKEEELFPGYAVEVRAGLQGDCCYYSCSENIYSM